MSSIIEKYDPFAFLNPLRDGTCNVDAVEMQNAFNKIIALKNCFVDFAHEKNLDKSFCQVTSLTGDNCVRVALNDGCLPDSSCDIQVVWNWTQLNTESGSITYQIQRNEGASDKILFVDSSGNPVAMGTPDSPCIIDLRFTTKYAFAEVAECFSKPVQNGCSC